MYSKLPLAGERSGYARAFPLPRDWGLAKRGALPLKREGDWGFTCGGPMFWGYPPYGPAYPYCGWGIGLPIGWLGRLGAGCAFAKEGLRAA